MEPSKNKENQNLLNNSILKKRNSPVSNLSASESEDEGKKRRKTETEDSFVESKETFSLPTIKIQPILGGKALSFPVHPRLTLIDLKDFILFALNIPHPQQILSFFDEESGKAVLLSNFSENALLCNIPGLIDEVTGRCAPVSLSFKMSSGMDFSVHPSDIEYESINSNSSGSSSNEYFGLGYNDDGFFEISLDTKEEDGEQNKKISALAASLASIIPLPPGVSKTSKMLFKSLSKSSPTNSNLPTLWEIYFPESGVKMMVTALINVSEVSGTESTGTGVESEKPVVGSEAVVTAVDNENANVTAETVEVPADETNSSKTVMNVPALVITPEHETTAVKPDIVAQPAVPTTAPIITNEPKNNCEKCRIRCRPALRFICKCNKTFCQSHRYPDQHDCTYDHRADGLATIQANNPKIVKDKVSNF